MFKCWKILEKENKKKAGLDRIRTPVSAVPGNIVNQLGHAGQVIDFEVPGF